MDWALFDKEYKHAFKVTEEVYKAFQTCSGDLNLMHTDAEYARTYGYQEKVMYGNILNGFVSYFVGMMLPIQNVVIISQDISYHKPVYMGDELLFEASVDNISEAVGMVEFKYIFKSTQGRVAKGHVALKALNI